MGSGFVTACSMQQGGVPAPPCVLVQMYGAVHSVNCSRWCGLDTEAGSYYAPIECATERHPSVAERFMPHRGFFLQVQFGAKALLGLCIYH
jgi:hypothetical protein